MSLYDFPDKHHAHGINFGTDFQMLNPEKGAVIHAGRHDYKTLCSPEFITLCPKGIHGRYAYYAMMSAPVRMQLQASVESVTNSHKRARVDRFLASKVDLPDIDTQKTIADFLDRETTRIDSLVSKTHRSIELLKEKRSTLITAAVTGQIDTGSMTS